MCYILFVPGGQTFLTHWREGGGTHFRIEWGGQTFLHGGGRNKHFYTEGGQIFYVISIGGYDDIDEEMDASKENCLVSKAKSYDF